MVVVSPCNHPLNHLLTLNIFHTQVSWSSLEVVNTSNNTNAGKPICNLPACILILYSFEWNSSFMVKTLLGSIVLALGSLHSMRWAILPSARGCSALVSSRSGMSVSPRISSYVQWERKLNSMSTHIWYVLTFSMCFLQSVLLLDDASVVDDIAGSSSLLDDAAAGVAVAP